MKRSLFRSFPPWQLLLSITVVLISVLLYCGNDGNAKRKNQAAAFLGFNLAKHPIVFSDSDIPLDPTDGHKLKDSESCKSCHEVQYENFLHTRHRVSFTNQLYQESHAREDSVWCINCHAPLMNPKGNPLSLNDRILKEEGISCVVCHVRDKKVLAPKMPNPSGKLYAGRKFYHDYEIRADFGKSEFCASCHQFNFPTSSTRSEGPIHYSQLVMQNTYEEWKSSSFRDKLRCQDCHVRPGTPASHSFPGGHSLDELKDAIQIEAERVASDHVLVRIVTMGIGHNFPTGDLFRTLRIRIADKDDFTLDEIILRKRYENRPKDSITPETANKFLKYDTTILPPKKGEYLSTREEILELDSSLEECNFEIYMDYLHETNHLTTKMSLKETMPLIKKGILKIKPLPEQGPKG